MIFAIVLFPKTPEELAVAIQNKWEDNEHFVSEIQNIPLKDFNALFWKFFHETEHAIDCTQCANCCKVFHAGLPEEEIRRLSAIRKMPYVDFVQQYVSIEQTTGIQFLKLNPCIFLNRNLCNIYEQRPQACRDFPKPPYENVKHNIRRVLKNYTVCPIIFNTIEACKKEFRTGNAP
jgi:hypothetical protein